MSCGAVHVGKIASRQKEVHRGREGGVVPHLDVPHGVEAVHLVQQLQHGALDLALAARLRLVALGANRINLICSGTAPGSKIGMYSLGLTHVLCRNHAVDSKHMTIIFQEIVRNSF